MNHLDLFSGIGGFSLSARWVWGEEHEPIFCEIDPFCQKVLRKHWPDAKIFTDIKEIMVDNGGNLLYFEEKGDAVMPKKRDPKYNNVVALYEKGMSIQDCADCFGVSRQAMHKVLKRRNVEFRQNSGSSNVFYRGGETQVKRVQGIVSRAIRKGVLIQQPCEDCGDYGLRDDGKNKVQAHHDDYSKPLDVRWLCRKCHYQWHSNNEAIGENEKGENGESAEGRGSNIDLLTGGFP